MQLFYISLRSILSTTFFAYIKNAIFLKALSCQYSLSEGNTFQYLDLELCKDIFTWM